jgi:16S rRNA (guanine527-N7)-methyltransferase
VNSVPADVEPLAQERIALLDRYLQTLLRENARFNLTAIRDEAEAWERHVIESLRLLPLLGEAASLLDVGSGGGIPGLVLAIVRPEIAVTLLEATGKKARFLEAVAADLRLANVRVICDRAELAGRTGSSLRESFDVVTARAVAPLRVLLEYAVPFAKLGGRIVAVKGERAAQEIAGAQGAMTALGARLLATHRQPTATVIVLEKTETTPRGLPRKPGEAKRKPL